MFDLSDHILRLNGFYSSKNIIEKLRKDPSVQISTFSRFQMSAGNVIIYNCVFTKSLFYENLFLGAIWGLINKAKNKGETSVTYSKNYGAEFKTKDIAKLFTLYEAELKKLNLVVCNNKIYSNTVIIVSFPSQDFDNLLLKACDLLQQKRNILANVEAIFVDEVRQFEYKSFRMFLQFFRF